MERAITTIFVILLTAIPQSVLFQLARNKSWVVKKRKNPSKNFTPIFTNSFAELLFLHLKFWSEKREKKSWELKFSTPIFSSSCFLRVGIGPNIPPNRSLFSSYCPNRLTV